MHTMEGCSAPLVVKFADTQKEKEAKRIQQVQTSLFNLTAGLNPSLGQTAATMTPPQLHPNPPTQASPYLATDAITPSQLQLLQQLQAVGLQQQLLQGGWKINSFFFCVLCSIYLYGVLKDNYYGSYIILFS